MRSARSSVPIVRPPLVAQLLGHSSTWVTERYMHLLDGHLEGARAVVRGYVGDGEGGREE